MNVILAAKSKKMKGYKSEVVVSEKPGVVLVQDEKKISKRKNKSHLSVKKKKSTGSDIIEDVTQISSVDGDFSDEIKSKYFFLIIFFLFFIKKIGLSGTDI